MLSRLTEPARRVLVLAEEEARRLGHGFIGTGHLLLGLLREEEEGASPGLLRSLGLTAESVRPQVGRSAETGEGDLGLVFSQRVKDTLEQSLRGALGRGLPRIRTQDMLLALVEEPEGVAAGILLEVGAEPESFRGQLASLESGWSQTPDQRDRALKRANRVRSNRARLKKDLKQGHADPVELVLDPPPELHTAKVAEMLLAIPKYGRVRVHRALQHCRISPGRTFEALSQRQRRELAEFLRP